MQPLGETFHHLRLLGRMGKTVEADLADAFEAGLISNTDWSDMITSCRGCAFPEKCGQWLDDHPTADAPIEGCCNADRLLALRKKLKKHQDTIQDNVEA